MTAPGCAGRAAFWFMRCWPPAATFAPPGRLAFMPLFPAVWGLCVCTICWICAWLWLKDIRGVAGAGLRVKNFVPRVPCATEGACAARFTGRRASRVGTAGSVP